MARKDIFTFRIDGDERRMLEELSSRLQRTQGDSVRLLIREAAKSLGADDGKPGVEAEGAR